MTQAIHGSLFVGLIVSEKETYKKTTSVVSSRESVQAHSVFGFVEPLPCMVQYFSVL